MDETAGGGNSKLPPPAVCFLTSCLKLVHQKLNMQVQELFTISESVRVQSVAPGGA
jgi:hypothetical protein